MKQILRLINEKGCTWEELADALNMQYISVARYLTGQKEPSKRFCEKALFFLSSV